MPTARGFLALAAGPNGKLYAIGGAVAGTAGNNIVNIVEEYDPATDTWATRAPLPAPRYALGAAPAGADGVTNPKHFFWGQGSSPQGTVDALSNDIIYHGGSAGPGAIGVEIKPAVYLIYWGPDWVQGFTVTDANGKTFSSKTLQSYLNSFFSNVGGSASGYVLAIERLRTFGGDRA